MNIPIIDTHVHMDTRSANDYELMAISGVKAVIVPATYTGEIRYAKEAYTQFYDKILQHEAKRSEAFGIKLFASVSVDPEDLHNIDIAMEVLELLPEYFKNPGVCAMGEIGLEKFERDEINLFLKQLALAKQYNMLVIMHTPHEDKEEKFPKMIKILDDAIKEMDLDPNKLLLDDLTIETLPIALDLKIGGYGIAVSPTLNGLYIQHKKATPTEAKAIIDEFGTDKIIFNSALAWGFGDPLGISRTLLHLKMMGVSEADLKKMAYDNAFTFFSQSPNFKM